MNKKAIELSLKMILGLVLAALVLIFLFAFIEDILSIFFPKPSAATTQNFERLVDEINNLEEGKSIEIPYYIYMKDNIKLVAHELDKECYPENCLCICKTTGCDKWRDRECFKGYNVVIGHAGVFGILNDERRISLLSVKKEPGVIKITDITVKPPSPDLICCRYVEGSKATTGGAGFYWEKEETCSESGGSEAPYPYCPKA